MISREMRYAQESQWTAAEALEWARARWPKWPSRRFRVDGSRVGNSRLLTLRAAEETAREFGGKIIELIPVRPRTVAS